LQLAATAALSNRAMSPLSKLRATRGLVTVKRNKDNDEIKAALAGREYPISGFKYKQPTDPVFRNTDPSHILQKGQADF